MRRAFTLLSFHLPCLLLTLTLRPRRAQACVVRIMKNVKQSTHADLVNGVINQLSSRFQPSPQMIKKSIERLIEKEYLERDEGDRKKLRYVVRFLSSPSLSLTALPVFISHGRCTREPVLILIPLAGLNSMSRR